MVKSRPYSNHFVVKFLPLKAVQKLKGGFSVFGLQQHRQKRLYVRYGLVKGVASRGFCCFRSFLS